MHKDKRERRKAVLTVEERRAPRWIRTSLSIGIGEYLGFDERGAIYGFRSGYVGPVAEENIIIASDKREEILISPIKGARN